ncbi:MAG: putative transcriptional regulator [Acidobacteriaceae bacterium]|nr:putative transcriptional regulator [Acidobacteriaceae bacterium]
MQMTIELNEADLLARMKNFEDHLVERKVVSDNKDWKKTAVAFANSVPVGIPAILFIGVRDGGEIETPQKNLDEAQKKFNSKMKTVYPRIFYVPKIVSENGLQALAVIIPGSELRPHFAGLAYVRRGSVTEDASEEQLSELIAQRNSKTATILRWKGKNVTVFLRSGDSEAAWPNSTIVVDCNQFYVSLQTVPHEPATSFPLSRVEINFDHARYRLQLEIADVSRNAWKVELERHARQIVGYSMTHEGRLLLRYLLIHGKGECSTPFMPEISMDTQNREMEIAVKNGLVERRLQKDTIPHSIYIVEAQYQLVLQKVLPDILKE